MFKNKQFPNSHEQLEQIILAWPKEAEIYDAHFEKYLKTSKSGLFYAFSEITKSWILWVHKSGENEKYTLSQLNEFEVEDA